MNEVTIRSDFNEWEACFLALCTSVRSLPLSPFCFRRL